MSNLINRIILRLTANDYDRLQDIATEEGTTVSKLVRGFIHDRIW